jgi:hypothetical protein
MSESRKSCCGSCAVGGPCEGGACSITKAQDHKDVLPGGLADKRKPEDFDQTKLFLGTATEMEHVSDPKVAMEIAMDHLMEDEDYYYKLHKIESAKSINWKVKKGRKLSRRMEFQGLKISVETDKGELRHWYDPANKEEGTTKMKYPYGYIRNTMVADDEHVDVYVGPNEDSDKVFIIHQMKAPNFDRYDEDKVMLGFTSAREAKAAYLEHYNKPGFFGTMTATDIDAFRRMFVGNTVKSLEAMIRSYGGAEPDLQKGILEGIRSLWNKVRQKFTGRTVKPTKVWTKLSEERCSTGVCEKLDGMEIDIDDEFPYVSELTGFSSHGPPAHHHCKCTLIVNEPVGKSIENEEVAQMPEQPTEQMPEVQPEVPMVPPMPMMVQPDPHDVETYDGVTSLLNRMGSAKDPELMQIASKIWGDGYTFEGQNPQQARAEILGFLLDQRDLLGVAPDESMLMNSPPSASLPVSEPPGSSDFFATSNNLVTGEGELSPTENSSVEASPQSPLNGWFEQDYWRKPA